MNRQVELAGLLAALLILSECMQVALNTGRIFLAGMLGCFLIALGAVTLSVLIALTEGTI